MHIRIATVEDAEVLMPFVRAYHEFDGIRSTEPERARSVAPLLSDSSLGRIWIILERGQAVGYIAVCFGYSIEFGARDAFLDEFFLVPAARSRGLGGKVLEVVKSEVAQLGVRAMHLEVASAHHLLWPKDFRRCDPGHLPDDESKRVSGEERLAARQQVRPGSGWNDVSLSRLIC